VLQVLRIGIDFPYQIARRIKYALDNKGDVASQEFLQLIAQFVPAPVEVLARQSGIVAAIVRLQAAMREL